MTLREKIGQLLLVGFRGLDVDERSPIVRDIRAGCVGGVILFDRDVALKSDRRNIRSPAQVRKLIAALQRAAPMPLLVAVDQEGGKVARLKKKHGFPETVSAQSLGEIDDPALTRRHADVTADALAAAGFNLNFAPVVDLDTHFDNPIIGKLKRSYSPDPALVVRHARAVVEAHHEHGVACCLKHFPGHGSSRFDSHLGLTDVSATWQPAEMEPFRALIAAGLADAVMTAHIFNRHLDPEFPATLSRATIEGLLRQQLGFKGVVVSDDLDMRAIANEYDRKRALELALNAGNDILLIANNLAYARNAASSTHAVIVGLVESGRVSESRIAAAWRRVRKLKDKLAVPVERT